MSKISVNKLLGFLKSAADCDGERIYHNIKNGIWSGRGHRGYVWGGQGQLYTRALAEQWHARAKAGAKSVPASRDKDSYYIGDCSRWIGYVIDDCSGLLVDALRSECPSFVDRASGTWIGQCVKTGAMADMPEVPGLILWRSGHVGVYIGGGMQIEARGTDYGVVVSPLASQPWTKWGYSMHVDYEGGDDDGERALARPIRGCVNGGSVNIRSGRSAEHEKLCVAYNKPDGERDELLLSNLQDGWYEVTLMPGSNGFRPVNGFVSAKYVQGA